MGNVEKVIRLSVEDSGFSSAVNRMGDNMRQAFENMGLNDILQEADQKFTTLSEKIKFINQEIGQMKSANWDELADEMKNVRAGHGTDEDKNKEIKRLDTETEKQNKSLDKVVESLEKFTTKVEKLPPRNGEDDGENDGGGDEGDSGGSGKGGGRTSRRSRGNATDIIRNFLGNGRKSMGRVSLDNIPKSLENVATTMARSLGAVGIVVAAAIAAGAYLAKKGYEDLRDENKLRARFDLGDDFADTGEVGRLGMSRKDFRALALSTSETRRSGFDIESQAIQRGTLMNAYGLQAGQISGLDQFYRAGANGENTLDTDGQMDALRIIQSVLVRSDQQGLLGVSRGDFTMLPEKIAQVQGIMQMQFANNERVNGNSAVNFIMAGQQIGGRFGDQRAGEAYGRIDQSIKNPGGPGMRAFIFDMLRRANPSGSYTDIMGQMEGGATSENLQAILPTISKLPQGEMRRMVLFQLTKNWQDANRLDQSGNLESMLQTLKQQPISDAQAQKQFGTSRDRSDKLTTEWDKTLKTLGNDVSEIGKHVANGAEWLLKHPPSGIFSGYGENTGKLYENNDIYKKNTVIQGSATGNQVQNK